MKKRKGNQRRLIHALPVNLELDLFEARIATLYDVVDVFLIGGKFLFYFVFDRGVINPKWERGGG